MAESNVKSERNFIIGSNEVAKLNEIAIDKNKGILYVFETKSEGKETQRVI